MIIPRWKDPGRKRNTEISYKDPDYCKYYDLDLEDFTHIVSVLKEGEILSDAENDRYRNIHNYYVSNSNGVTQI